jgi:hypothetical protein
LSKPTPTTTPTTTSRMTPRSTPRIRRSLNQDLNLRHFISSQDQITYSKNLKEIYVRSVYHIPEVTQTISTLTLTRIQVVCLGCRNQHVHFQEPKKVWWL